MPILDGARHSSVPSPVGRPPLWRRAVAAAGVAVVVALGMWAAGALVTEDAAAAMVLTGGWLLLAGAAAVWVAWRRRGFAVPVVGAYLMTAGVLGGYLFVTSTVDTRVDEQVVVAQRAPAAAEAEAAERAGAATTSSPGTAASRPAPVLVADGVFRSGAHETTGRAALVKLPAGGHVVTLTDLATDPGPDLRVYLVPGDGSSVRGGTDLGRLKGNEGSQQYAVPAGAPRGAVVIWCRAFSVSFGAATLA